MTSSNGNIFRVTGPLCGEFTVPLNSPHKGQWRGALMFSLICVWINGWVNNREVGDLRRHRGHYDVNVMWQFFTCHKSWSVVECGKVWPGMIIRIKVITKTISLNRNYEFMNCLWNGSHELTMFAALAFLAHGNLIRHRRILCEMRELQELTWNQSSKRL